MLEAAKPLRRGARAWDLAGTAAPSPWSGVPSCTRGTNSGSAACFPDDLPGDVWGPLQPSPSASDAQGWQLHRAHPAVLSHVPQSRLPAAVTPTSRHPQPGKRHPASALRVGSSSSRKTFSLQKCFLAFSFFFFPWKLWTGAQPFPLADSVLGCPLPCGTPSSDPWGKGDPPLAACGHKVLAGHPLSTAPTL